MKFIISNLLFIYLMPENSLETDKRAQVNSIRKKQSTQRDIIFQEHNNSQSNAKSVISSSFSEADPPRTDALLANNKNDTTFSQVSQTSSPKIKSKKSSDKQIPSTPIFRVRKQGQPSTASPSKKQVMTSTRSNKDFLNVVFTSPSVEHDAKSSLETPNKSLMFIGDRKKLNFSPLNKSGSQSKRQPLQFSVKNGTNDVLFDSPTLMTKRQKEFWSPSPKKKWTSFQPDGLSDFIQGALSDIQHQVAGYDIKNIDKQTTGDANSNRGISSNSNKNAPFLSTANTVVKVEKCVRLNRFCYRMLVTDIANKDTKTIVLVDTISSKQDWNIRSRSNNSKKLCIFENGDRVIIGKTFYELDGLKYYIHWKKIENE